MPLRKDQTQLVLLWPLSTSRKHLLITPLFHFIHPSFTLFPFSLCLALCPYRPLWPSSHPLLQLLFICPLTFVHTPIHASVMECTKPWILGITSTDLLSPPLLYFPPFMPLSCCTTVFIFISTCTLSFLLPTFHSFFSPSPHLVHHLSFSE